LPSDYRLSPALKQNLGGHKLKGYCDAETCDTVGEDTTHGLMCTADRSWTHDMTDVSAVAGNVWKVVREQRQ